MGLLSSNTQQRLHNNNNNNNNIINNSNNSAANLARTLRRFMRSDMSITIFLFILSLILFALPNVLLLNDSSAGNDRREEGLISRRGLNTKDDDNGSVVLLTTNDDDDDDDDDDVRKSNQRTRQQQQRKQNPLSNSKKMSSSSSSNNSENSNRATDGGIYRRMYNITERFEVDVRLMDVVLDAKVQLELLPKVEIDPKILPTGLHQRDLFITALNAKKFKFETLPKRYLAQDFENIKLRFKDVDSKLSDLSCAIVGSSGNVIGRNFANAIESHDSVIRLNQAPADSVDAAAKKQGHTKTKDVGERSNFRALSKPWIHKYSLPEKGGLSPADLPLEWGANLILTGATKGITLQSVGLATALREKWRRTDVQLVIITPKMEAAARDFFQLYRWKLEKLGFTLKTKGTQPSVGFISAFSLLQVCDRVSLYGFGRTTADGFKLEKYRYFDSGKGRFPSTREIAQTGMDVEVALFRALAREKRLVYCDDDEKTNMDCGNLHFRNSVFGVINKPETLPSTKTGNEKDNNNADADAEQDYEEEEANDTEEETPNNDVVDNNVSNTDDAPGGNGWADLV